MSRLVALYPRTWRDRYEEEFLALLAERPPGPLDRLDIVRGAVDARLHPQAKGMPIVPEAPIARGPWPVRAGLLTLAGGVLYVATMILAVNAPIVVETTGRTYRDAAAAMPLFFAAVVLLGVGMLAVVIGLPGSANVARTAAFVSSMVGVLWALAPWLMFAGLIAFVGLFVVGVAARRAGHWSSLELALLAVGLGLGWVPVIAFGIGAWVPRVSDPDLQYLILSMLAVAWAVVGFSLVRAPRRRVALLDPPGS